jgi:endo-alpha-N-acetylgalactosaminidase
VGEVIAGGIDGDVNGDGRVDLIDLAIVLASYGKCRGEPGYDGRADLDGDNCIGLGDLAIVLANFGR